MTLHRKIAPVFMLMLVAGAYTACGGPSPRALCEDACECIGCSNSELEACVEELEEDQDRAEEAGCADEYDAYLDCLGGFECDGGDVEVPDECEDLEDDLDDACGRSNSTSGGGICQLAADKIAACQGVDSEPSPAQCSDAVACVSQCVLDVDCGAFDGSDQAAVDAFQSCAASCGG